MQPNLNTHLELMRSLFVDGAFFRLCHVVMLATLACEPTDSEILWKRSEWVSTALGMVDTGTPIEYDVIVDATASRSGVYVYGSSVGIEVSPDFEAPAHPVAMRLTCEGDEEDESEEIDLSRAVADRYVRYEVLRFSLPFEKAPFSQYCFVSLLPNESVSDYAFDWRISVFYEWGPSRIDVDIDVLVMEKP